MKRIFWSTLFLLAGATSAQAASYTFTTFDPPGAAGGSAAIGINSAGQIIGGYYDAGNVPHNYLLSGGVYTTIDVPGSTDTAVHGINDAGQIVGSYFDGTFEPSTGNERDHGFLLSGGSYTTLDVPGSVYYGANGAYGINASGQIVGSYVDPLVFHGYSLSGSVYTAIDPPFPRDTNAAGGATAISNTGQIVGLWRDAANNYHGYLLSNGSYASLDVPYPGSTGTLPSGINDAGQIVGVYYDPDANLRGFLLSGGVYSSLDFLAPTGIPPGVGSDFPNSIGVLPAGINNAGQIVGSYSDANGAFHSFLATPVPEPSSIALLIIGTIGLAAGVLRSRRNRTAINECLTVGAGILCALIEGGRLLRLKSCLSLAVAAVCTWPATCLVAATSYDAVTDFAAGSNPSGAWNYLFATSVGGSLTPLIAEPAVSVNPPVDAFGTYIGFPDTVQVFRNLGPGTWNFLTISDPANLLAIDPQGDVADVRWTAPATGNYSVSGLFQVIDYLGFNHEFLVLRDYNPGSTLFSHGGGTNGQQFPFSFSGSFSAGETIDFIIDGNGNASDATVGLAATVSAVPEPSSALLVALGIVGLLGAGWRR